MNFTDKAGWQSRISPLILAGGKSRRMGKNKAFVKLGDKALIEIVVEKVTAIFNRKPVISTNTPDEYAYLGCSMVGDRVQGKGPLGGMHAGLLCSPTPYIFVFACDMPFIEEWFVCYMISRLGNEDILVPHNGESVEPLHAIYARRCLPAIEAQLDADRRCVQSFFPDVSLTYIEKDELQQLGLPDCYFLNLNTAEDLQQAKVYLDNR